MGERLQRDLPPESTGQPFSPGQLFGLACAGEALGRGADAAGRAEPGGVNIDKPVCFFGLHKLETLLLEPLIKRKRDSRGIPVLGQRMFLLFPERTTQEDLPFTLSWERHVSEKTQSEVPGGRGHQGLPAPAVSSGLPGPHCAARADSGGRPGGGGRQRGLLGAASPSAPPEASPARGSGRGESGGAVRGTGGCPTAVSPAVALAAGRECGDSRGTVEDGPGVGVFQTPLPRGAQPRRTARQPSPALPTAAFRTLARSHCQVIRLPVGAGRRLVQFLLSPAGGAPGHSARPRPFPRLHRELPLSLEELEDVFDALDADGNGLLTPEEFTAGFSHFFFSQHAPGQEDAGDRVAPRWDEKVYQSRAEEDLGDMDEDEEAQFQMLMGRLGAQNVLEDESDVKQLWLQLKKDEPHLLSNFEDFLTRIFSLLQEAHEEKNELECALKKKIAAYDEEIQHLYEEMEQQIKSEKERFLLKDTERFQARSQELDRKLLSKERELEQLVQKQRRLEGQCTALHDDKRETKAENAKLKLTNQELAQELERTSRELQGARQQLEGLQREACRLQQEKEMEVYRVTESLQREKSGLLKQLDFLRERNKHLRDERDIRFQKDKAAKANTAASKASRTQRSGSVIGKYVDSGGILRSQSEEEEGELGIQRRRSSLSLSGYPLTEEDPGTREQAAGGPRPGALPRIISIEEDAPPQLPEGGAGRPLSSRPEEEEEEVFDQGGGGQTPQQARPSPLAPASPRTQPVGKEAVSKEEGSPSTPDRLFKIVFVGNSAVGKTSFLRRFCDDRFPPGMTATVGIDYRVKMVHVGDSQVALQLWDTAGQERYRCITQQFFRKADGVIVMYDLTAKQSFLSVRQWLSSVEEAVGDRIPVLLLGNKIDNEKEREVPRGLGEQLAKENNLIFYECSAYSGHNTKESLLHLARTLKEQEDSVREDIVQVGRPAKKKACCG